MAMPNHLVLVRHGESEGNFVRSAYKQGDLSYLTDEFRERPGHDWRITPLGVEQAQAAGEWVTKNVLDAYNMRAFGRLLYSPHRRTRETAGNMGLPGAEWELNRMLREREWGEIAGLIEAEHKEKYPRNFKWMNADPLHWAPPGGESISEVADNRVREVLDSLHRDHDNKGVESVVAVTHGEFIWASRLVLDYMFNEDYEASEHDVTQRIHNCQVVHYTRLSPYDGSQAEYLKWNRSVWPWKDPDDQGTWKESARQRLGNEALLAQAEAIPRLFH